MIARRADCTGRRQMTNAESQARRPLTPAALSAFFAFATLMTAITAITLLAPGGPLDAIWVMKPREYQQLKAMGPWVCAGFVALSLAAAVGAVGLFRRRSWGWRFAVAAFAINGLSDAARIAFGAVLEGLIGVAVAGLVLAWLTRPRVRALFDR